MARLRWIVLKAYMYMHVKFERVIIHGFPKISLNTNFYLTSKLELLKVKVKDKACKR